MALEHERLCLATGLHRGARFCTLHTDLEKLIGSSSICVNHVFVVHSKNRSLAPAISQVSTIASPLVPRREVRVFSTERGALSPAGLYYAVLRQRP